MNKFLRSLQPQKKIQILFAILFFIYIAALLKQTVTNLNLYKLNSRIDYRSSNEPILMTIKKGDDGWRSSASLNLDSTRIPHQITLILATYGKKIAFVSAKISGNSCLWTVRDNDFIEDNKPLTWTLDQCSASKVYELTLEIETKEKNQISIWSKPIHRASLIQQPKHDQIFIENSLKSNDDMSFLAEGSLAFSSNHKQYKRYQLLSYLWDLDPTSPIIIAGIVILFLLLLFSLASTKSVSYLGLAITLGMLQIIITPPFHGPDEPDHFLSMLTYVKNYEVKKDALRLANRGHFERIKAEKYEIFKSHDLINPREDKKWAGHITEVRPSKRSPLAAKIWSLFANIGLAKNKNSAFILFTMRTLQFLIVVLTLAAIVKLIPDKNYIYLSIIISMPVMFLFSFHISNYFTAVTLSITGGYILSYLILNPSYKPSVFYILTLLVALLPYSAKISLGTSLFWLCLMPIFAYRISISYPTSAAFKSRAKHSIIFLMIWILANYSMTADYFEIFKTHFLKLPKLLDVKLSRALHTVITMMPVVVVCLWLPKFRFKKIGNLTFLTKALQGIVITTPIAWILVWAYSFFVLDKGLPNIETNRHIPINSVVYSIDSVRLFFANLFLIKPDLYISSTFWGGFGWLEKIPSDIYINLLALPTAIGILLGLIVLSIRRSPELAFGYIVTLLCLVGMIFGLAYDRSIARVNLHGRYLIFAYTVAAGLSSVGWTIFLNLFKSKFSREKIHNSEAKFQTLAIGAILLSHSVAISHLLRRFFG